MSAERLREAARVLRERADAATPGPWAHGETWATVNSGSDSVFHGYYVGKCESCGEKIVDDAQVAIGEEDAAYIAMMHPGVGLALADWLEDEAGRSEMAEDDGTDARIFEPAERIADLILGGTP